MMARKRPQASTTRRVHRSIGAGAAIFVVFIVLSGLALNHSHQLGLDQQRVAPSFLLRWYGLGEPTRLQSFAVGEQWLSFAGSQLYLNGANVATTSDGVGAVASGDWLVAAGSEELLLLNRDGGLIERQPWDQPGAGLIEAIGRLDTGSLVVKSAGQTWLADAELLEWKRLEPAPDTALWATSQAAPAAIQKAILQQYQGEGLSLERLLLDVHSGRIFGPAGIIVYDLLALALGALVLSGLVLWWRGRRNGQRNGNNRRKQ